MDIWEATRDESLELTELLSELDEEQWNMASLCDEWRIRDVLAHLTAGAEGAFGVGAIVRGLLRHGFNYNRWVAVDGRARGQQDPELTLKALRDAATNRSAPPRGRPVTGLMHVLIHGQDICRPLGIREICPSRISFRWRTS